MVLQYKILRELALAAGLWLTASAAMAGPQPGHDMALGRPTPPPNGYVEFCERKPQDCGADSGRLAAAAALAMIEETAVAARLGRTVAPVMEPASLGAPPEPSARIGRTTASESEAPEPVALVRVALVERATLEAHADFIDPGAQTTSGHQTRAPVESRELWSLITRINADVNRAIAPRTDAATYGRDDVWNTPLEDGIQSGDCEDYALEKQRALVAAGVPREALNIAVVVTPALEPHAVLLVSTQGGEYVLDSLSPWVTPWREVPYLWIKREVDGNPFEWREVSPEASATFRPQGRVLLARLH